MFDEMYMVMAYSQIFLTPVVMALVLLPILVYLVARWRSYREESTPDSQIGIKVAICWFKIAAFQMLLLGTFLILVAVLADLPGEFNEQLVRIALGISLPSAVIYGVQEFAIRSTNSDERPSVHRMFAGISLVQTGVVAFSALMYGGVALFQENVPSEINRIILSAVLVYVCAVLMQGTKLLRISTGYGGYGGLPSATATAANPEEEG